MCICKCCGETSVYINSDEIRDYLGKYCSQCHVKFLKEYDIIPDDDKTLQWRRKIMPCFSTESFSTTSCRQGLSFIFVDVHRLPSSCMVLTWLYLIWFGCYGFESQRHPFSALPKTARGEFPPARAVSISEKRLNVVVCIPIRARDYDVRPCAV